METCTKCGWKLPDHAEVCPYCGQRVESDEEKKRLKLRLPTEEPPPPLSRPTPAKAASGTQARKRTAIVLTAALFTGILLVGSLAIILWPRPTPNPPAPNQALMITPSSLDFGSVTKGNKAILSVIITKSGSTKPMIDSKEPWLKVAFRTQKSLQNNQYEMIYDVIADTGPLQPATYKAQLAIAADGGKQVPVNAQVQVIQQIAPAHLNVNPTLLDFSTQSQDKQVTAQIVMISNTGGKELTWSVNPGKVPPWLTFNRLSDKIAAGGLPQIITVGIKTTNLQPGPYEARVDFKSNENTVTVQVKFTISPQPPPPPSVTPNPLDFGEVSQDATKTLVIHNPGGQELPWSVDIVYTAQTGWLSMKSSDTLPSGKLEQSIPVTIDVYDEIEQVYLLKPGNYSATLNFTLNGEKVPVAVRLVVPAPPKLSVSPNPLDFGTVYKGTTKTLPEAIDNTGGQSLTWSVDTGQTGWLSVKPSSDTVSAGKQQIISVTVDTSNLDPGNYPATLNFTSNGGRMPVTVRLVVIAPDVVPVPDPTYGFSRQDNQGQLIVTVKNQGSAGAGSFVTKVDFSSGTISMNTPPLAPGESVDLFFPIPSGCFDPDCSFTITVDTNNQLIESNEANNIASGTFIG